MSNISEEDIDIEGLFDKIEEPKANPIQKESLKLYYEKLFPYTNYFKWFGQGDSHYFERREFSFTLEGDIYCRFLCFKGDIDFQNEMIRAMPIKIDVGAVYNTLPKLRKSADSFVPQEKELIFDIDMTDYDEVRTCCKDTKMCNKCWKYMIIAYRILNESLVEDFGFKSIMWVFSGRRGIHCWVGDSRARKLTNEGRSSIANFLKWKTINKTTGVTHLIRDPLHPSVDRAYKIIRQNFKEYALEGQDILNVNGINDMFMLIVKAYFGSMPNSDVLKADIQKVLFNRNLQSTQKWEEVNQIMVQYEQRTIKNKNMKFMSKREHCLMEVMMYIMYPRLDINVTKHINHLLKSPFCVHPKTGMISVPLSEDDIINFDINSIPTLEDSVSDLIEGKKGKYYKFMSTFENLIKSFDLKMDN